MTERTFPELTGVLFLTGPPGAGKTTVAKALMKRHGRALHIDVDTLRGFVRPGFADPTVEWNDDTREQFRLARTAARAIAEIYGAAGYLAIVDDMFVPSTLDPQLWSSTVLPVVGRVVLLPRLSVALARNAERDRGEVTKRLEALIPSIAEEFRSLPPDGHWTILDTSDMTIEETTEAVEAIVRGG